MSVFYGRALAAGGRGSSISAPIIGKDFNWTGADGTYQVIQDDETNWRIKFLSSGTFTPLKNMVIDAFLVGGGGGGGSVKFDTTKDDAYSGSGGGGGYTTTVKSIVLAANTGYEIVSGIPSNLHVFFSSLHSSCKRFQRIAFPSGDIYFENKYTKLLEHY